MPKLAHVAFCSLLPDVMSWKLDVNDAYSVFGPFRVDGTPARANRPPRYGADALVPPTTMKFSGCTVVVAQRRHGRRLAVGPGERGLATTAATGPRGFVARRRCRGAAGRD